MTYHVGSRLTHVWKLNSKKQEKSHSPVASTTFQLTFIKQLSPIPVSINSIIHHDANDVEIDPRTHPLPPLTLQPLGTLLSSCSKTSLNVLCRIFISSTLSGSHHRKRILSPLALIDGAYMCGSGGKFLKFFPLVLETWFFSSILYYIMRGWRRKMNMCPYYMDWRLLIILL